MQSSLVYIKVGFLGTEWLVWYLKRTSLEQQLKQTSRTEYRIIDMISEDFLPKCQFYFTANSCMCVAPEDTNLNVNSHFLIATHFSHSTMTSLNIVQNGRPRSYGSRTKSKEDYRYEVGVLSKPIGTFLLPWYYFSSILFFIFFSTAVLI